MFYWNFCLTMCNILHMKSEVIRIIIADRINAAGLKRQELALRAGLSREMLYKFLAGKSDMSFSGVAHLVEALGYRLELVKDFDTLPQNHRQVKSRKQAAYIARGDAAAKRGIALGARLENARIPDLGNQADEW
jgi:DNA-binding phage protein